MGSGETLAEPSASSSDHLCDGTRLILALLCRNGGKSRPTFGAPLGLIRLWHFNAACLQNEFQLLQGSLDAGLLLSFV